jgi:uncharacterized HAD superfamily protein
MCLTCGCGAPTSGHGPGHITLADLAAAADAADITVLQAAVNLRTTLPVPGPLPHLYCDVDGVLAFQPEGSIIAVNARYNTTYLVPEATTYPFWKTLTEEQQDWQRKTQPIVDANLAPDTIAVDVLRRAVTHGYPLTVCTERDPAMLATITKAWVAFWDIPADNVAVVGPGGKVALLEAHDADNPAILIDDDPGKEDTIPRAGVSLWVPCRPWTPQDDPPDGVWRFGDWGQAALALGLA